MANGLDQYREEVTYKVVPNKDAPMMIHEQVASGNYGAQEFVARRDITGLHWQVQIGEETALFSLTDLLQAVVISVTDKANEDAA